MTSKDKEWGPTEPTAALLCADPGAVADRDLLALILPPSDRLAGRALLDAFGSVPKVLAADAAALAAVAGEGPALVVKAVAQAAARLARTEAEDKPVMNNYRKVVAYLRAVQGRDKIESFRLLFLDKQNRLAADEVLCRGTIDHVAVYPRDVARRALAHGATALLLAHNHPSGNPSPSDADRRMTDTLKAALAPLGVHVLDHLIVSAEGDTSFRALGLI